MMTSVREWLIGLVVVTLLLSVVQMLIPKGTLRQIASFVGGLLLLAALLRPLLSAVPVQLELELDVYRSQIQQREAEFVQEETAALQTLIAEQTASYISEEAARLGVSVTVQVETVPGEDNVPLPWSVQLTGTRSQALSEWIASELAIPAERQVWHEGLDES